jgi:hypothetical protein
MRRPSLKGFPSCRMPGQTRATRRSGGANAKDRQGSSERFLAGAMGGACGRSCVSVNHIAAR